MRRGTYRKIVNLADECMAHEWGKINFSLIVVQTGKGVLEDVKADIFTEKEGML